MNHFKNLKKEQAAIEIATSSAIIPLLALLAAGLEDDDDEIAKFALLQLMRLEVELGGFYNPNEQFKLLKSPIPGMRVVTSSTQIIGDLIAIPLDGFKLEGATQGKNKGIPYLWRDIKSVTPILNKVGQSYGDKIDYLQLSGLW